MFGVFKRSNREKRPSLRFVPQKDITAYELAIFMKRVNHINVIHPENADPPYTAEEADAIDRHFQTIED